MIRSRVTWRIPRAETCLPCRSATCQRGPESPSVVGRTAIAALRVTGAQRIAHGTAGFGSLTVGQHVILEHSAGGSDTRGHLSVVVHGRAVRFSQVSLMALNLQPIGAHPAGGGNADRARADLAAMPVSTGSRQRLASGCRETPPAARVTGRRSGTRQN